MKNEEWGFMIGSYPCLHSSLIPHVVSFIDDISCFSIIHKPLCRLTNERHNEARAGLAAAEN